MAEMSVAEMSMAEMSVAETSVAEMSVTEMSEHRHCIGQVRVLHVVDQRFGFCYIYYSKFDKGQTFIFFCRRSCLSDTKHFMIDI